MFVMYCMHCCMSVSAVLFVERPYLITQNCKTKYLYDLIIFTFIYIYIYIYI